MPSDHFNNCDQSVSEIAAKWWAEHLIGRTNDEREAFRIALLDLLPEDDWVIRCDYDPDATLKVAIDASGIELSPILFTAKGVLPTKTIMRRSGDSLLVKCGYGQPFEPVITQSKGE